MLFCKLLLSPLPARRVKHVDTRAALAMPDVKAILMAHELPRQPIALRHGTVIKAMPKSERALTMEPLIRVSRFSPWLPLTNSRWRKRLKKIQIDFQPLPL